MRSNGTLKRAKIKIIPTFDVDQLNNYTYI